MEIYVKGSSNCAGMPLQQFKPLAPTWTGARLRLATSAFAGYEGPHKTRTVIGWTDLYGGRPAAVHVTKVQRPDGATGYLIHGGNCGLRILDRSNRPPAGYGVPIIWLDNPADLPATVRAQVG